MLLQEIYKRAIETVLKNKKEEIKNRIDLINRGEVPEGYKKVHGYIIPTDWQITRFNKIFERITKKNDVGCENVLTISAQYGLINQQEFFKKSIASADTSNYFLLNKNDFAYNKSYSAGYPFGTIKKMKLYEQGIVSPLYICFRVKPKLMNIDYIEQYFDANKFNSEILAIAQEGARNHGLLNMSIDDFFNCNIVKPSQQEQEKIAKILNCCDKVIELKQKLLEEKNKEKKWLVKNLIQPKTILNCNDKTYKEYEFEDVIIKLPTKKYQINTTEYLTIGKYPVVDQGKNKIIAYCNNSEKLYKCPINGIIVFGDHTREIKYIDFDFVIGADGTQILSVQNGISVKYIYYYLLNQRIPNIGYNRHYKFLKNILFMIPSQEKQKHVVQILSKIDNHIEYLEQELKQYKQLKKSLSQLLLTGIVRTMEADCEN